MLEELLNKNMNDIATMNKKVDYLENTLKRVLNVNMSSVQTNDDGLSDANNDNMEREKQKEVIDEEIICENPLETIAKTANSVNLNAIPNTVIPQLVENNETLSLICGLCDESCDSVPALKSHIQTHERIPQIDGHVNSSLQQDFSVIVPDRFGRFVPAIWHRCEKCDFQSTSDDALRKHISKKHNANKSSRRKKKHT